MLAFFRKIRKGLLSENKITKYLLYAFGEIILVVIGILIALQINEWNNAKKAREKELAYLEEIKDNLLLDSKNIDSVLQFNKTKVPVVKAMMQMFNDTLTNNDRIQIFNSNSDAFVNYAVFEPQKTAFSNMLSAETIDLIQDKELRQALTAYYEFDYTGGVQFRIRQMNRRIVDRAFPIFFTKENAMALLKVPTDMPPNKDLEIHKDQWLLSEFYGLIYIINLQDKGLVGFKKNIEQLLNLIDETLKSQA